MNRRPNPELIDDENPELDEAWFKRARPAREVLPPELYAALTDKSQPVIIEHVSDAEHKARLQSAKKRAGRPPLAAPKVSTTIRLDDRVLSAFKAIGSGWQTRMNAILLEAVEQGRI